MKTAIIPPLQRCTIQIAALALVLGSVAALAQGKIGFQNDSLRLVWYGGVYPPDSALLGQCVDTAHMPGGVTLVADLYVGTSSTTMSLISTTTFSAVPGKWSTANVTVPGIPGDTSVFVAAQVRDQADPAPATFNGYFFGSWWAASSIFTFTLGSSVTYPVMWGPSGNWPAGTYALDQYGAGSKGAIGMIIIPEPTSCALAVLGLAALAILRRCK